MWFKNLKLYRLAPNHGLTAADLEAALAPLAFRPCGSQDSQSSGWVFPREDSGLAYASNGQILITLCTEKRLLPATVINQAARERALQIEEQQGYKPGRKQMKEIKEQVTMDLLPKAFVTQSDTNVWIDTKNGWFVIDASAAARADEVLGLLAKTLTPFPIVPLHVEMSPGAAMTLWLTEDEAPAGFTIDQETELQSTGGSRAMVRYVRQSVDHDEATKHVRAGKQCTRLAMTWNDRVSFVLTENLDIKRVAPLDVLKERQDAQAANEAEQFEADFALMAGELARMLDDLVAALGGERRGES
ncbi:recombination-associated protein RdgC [Castellaniella ginsengisoli]|uniref:Recombination-associated protein RdgC n=1 Tax=Castellaniella ginsengisoli TaxID=546114 RepID=A0AB39DNG4_9BURK